MSLENTGEQTEDPVYVPTRKEQDDISYATDFQKQCFDQTKVERSEWRVALQRYNLQRNISRYDYIDDVHIGLTYDAVERVASALPGREFGFRAKPRGTEDVAKALLFSEALSNAWNSVDVMDGPSKMATVKRSMALFGSCPVQLYWDVKLDSAGNVIKSDPGFYPLNIFNFYANKFSSEIEECNEVGYISEMSLDAFRKSAKAMGYKNWKKVRGVSPTKSQGQDMDSSSTDNLEGVHASGDKLNVVKIFEVQSDDTILTIALDAQPVWLRKIPNPLGTKNCVMFRYKRSPLPNRLYGVSDIQRGGELEDSIQESFNQMTFNHLLVDNPGFTYNKLDQNIDPRTFVMAPGAGIPRGQDPNSITTIQFNSHLNESMTVIDNMLGRYKRLVNNPDTLAGVSDKGIDSATESGILDANTKATFNSIVDEMKSAMYRVARLLTKMYEVYGPESITIKTQNPQLIDKLTQNPQNDTLEVEMPKEDFVLDRDVEVIVDFTTQNKEIVARNLETFLAVISKDELVPPQIKMAVYQEYLSMKGLEDIAKLFDSVMNQNQASDVALADQENQKMMNGIQLPPTPGATPAHTQRHLDAMRSPQTGPEVDRLMQPHIEGEIAGQQNAMQGGSPSQEGGEAPTESAPQPTSNTMTQ